MNETVAVLQLLQTKGLGTATLRRLFLMLASEGRSITDYVAEMLSNTQLSQNSKDIWHTVVAGYDDALLLYEQLEREHIQVRLIGSPTYPQHLWKALGNSAPPILFTYGNTALFDYQGVGFCGSRKASDKGLALASESAKILAQKHMNIISGYANGVDLATHRSALEHGGVTTFVLPEGILHFRRKAEIADLLQSDNFLVVSEFPPGLPWIARNAMQRNRTIIGLSQAMIVIESGLKGGTFDAGETTLKLKRPLFVLEYAHPEPSAEGNSVLIQKGGHAIRKSKGGDPNLTPIFQSIRPNALPVAQASLI